MSRVFDKVQAEKINAAIMRQLHPHLQAMSAIFQHKAKVTVVVTVPDRDGCLLVSSSEEISEDHNILIKSLQENMENSGQMVRGEY